MNARQRLDYGRRSEPDKRFVGFDADTPVAGFYRTRLRSGAVYVGVRIWFGPPNDPDTGEEMDRSHRWQAQANGRHVDLERVWPKCADAPIGDTEYAYLATLQSWGEAHAPDGPQANPTRRINPLTAPTPF